MALPEQHLATRIRRFKALGYSVKQITIVLDKSPRTIRRAIRMAKKVERKKNREPRRLGP